MVSNPFPLVLNIIEHPKKKQKHIENIGSFHIIETFFFQGDGITWFPQPAPSQHRPPKADTWRWTLPSQGGWRQNAASLHHFTMEKRFVLHFKMDYSQIEPKPPICLWFAQSDFATFSISSQISGWVRGSFLCSVVIKRPFSCFYRLSFVPTPETVPEPSWVWTYDAQNHGIIIIFPAQKPLTILRENPFFIGSIPIIP